MSKRSERAQHFPDAFRIVFSDPFSRFQTVFRIDLNIFRGQFLSADGCHPNTLFPANFRCPQGGKSTDFLLENASCCMSLP